MGEEVEIQEQRATVNVEKISVSVRLRPLNEKERAKNSRSDWECIKNDTIVFKHSLPDRSMFPATYTFEFLIVTAIQVKCTGKELDTLHFQCSMVLIVSSLGGRLKLSGAFAQTLLATVFAYGQTSSGKTYTMRGITEYAISDIYVYMEKHVQREFLLKFSAMEIYNEAVRDLLSPDSTPLRLLDDPERGTVVEKLIEEAVRDRNHLQELISICEAQRQIEGTALNETSSRSHQILRLTIESSACEYAPDENPSVLAASVNFVDLAGSERGSQTLSAGARLKEGCHINRSLLTLGTVIRKLSKGRNAHVPYRDSKLTRILQNSLGGNAKTAIICTMSPARIHVEQSRNTLLFASCARQVATNAQINLVMSDKALVKQLQRELNRLEKELKSLGSTSIKSDNTRLMREKELLIGQMANEIEELTRQRDLAEHRLTNFLLSVKEVQMLKQCEDSSSNSSEVTEVPSMVDFNVHRHPHIQRLPRNKDCCPNLPEKSEDAFLLDDSTPKFAWPDPCKDWEDGIAHKMNEGYENNRNDGKSLMDEAIVTERATDSLSLDPEEQKGKLVTKQVSPKKTEARENIETKLDTTENMDGDVVTSYSENDMQSDLICTDETYQALKERVKELQSTIKFLVKTQQIEQSPCFSDASSSCSSSFNRSRSCRAIIATAPYSPFFEKAEQSESTIPIIRSANYFPERPIQKPCEVKYDKRNERMSRKNSQTSLSSFSEEVLSTNDSDLEDSFNTHYFPRSEKPFGNNFVSRRTASSPDIAADISEMKPLSVKQVGKILAEEPTGKSYNSTGKIEDAMQINSGWPSEFEKKQRKIVELWDACNVPLMHRAYFFLLFNGDPSDAVYMEVELRRLLFLKNSMSVGGSSRKDNPAYTTIISSVKDLIRERGMLRRQIQKFSTKQKEELFKKWGIRLDTKQRSLQLARRVWTNTNDMVHVKESAELVAKLLGVFDSIQSPKEIVGLNFLPPSMTRRSYSWRIL